MGFSKQIISGEYGSVTISEAAGVATVAASANGALGGGSVAGVASVSATVAVNLSAKQLIDAGFALAEAKFPTVAPFLKMANDAMDAEIAALG